MPLQNIHVMKLKTYNDTKSCHNNDLNKDSNSVTVPIIYLDFKGVFNEKNGNVPSPP